MEENRSQLDPLPTASFENEAHFFPLNERLCKVYGEAGLNNLVIHSHQGPGVKVNV